MSGGQHQKKVICIDKLLVKFAAPLGRQGPAKTDVELPLVKRLELLSVCKF
jgi:hypothetical protein